MFNDLANRICLRLTYVASIALLLVAADSPAHAEIVINQLGVTAQQTFETFTGAGMQPGGGSGTLDSNTWQIGFWDGTNSVDSGLGATHGSGLFGRGTSTGGATQTGVYAFQTGGGNTALGIQADTEGFFSALPEFTVRNNTGFVVDAIEITYDIFVFNDTDTEFFADLELFQNGLFIDPVFFETPLLADPVPTWQQTPLDYLFLPPEPATNNPNADLVALQQGDAINIGWAIGDLAGTGFSDGIGIDNINVTFYSSTSVPEPSSVLLLGALGTMVVVRRSRSRRRANG